LLQHELDRRKLIKQKNRCKTDLKTMVIDTRSTPDFPHDSQKELFSIRKEFALMAKFPYDPGYEQMYIGMMTGERAI